MSESPAPPAHRRSWRPLLPLVTWALAGAVAVALDGQADLGSQALPLVLAAALASQWWPVWASLLACVSAVAAFNWSFVPPRGSFSVRLERDVLLLAVMLSVSLGVALLTSRQRRLAEQERRQRERVDRLYDLSEALRRADRADAVGAALLAALGPVVPAGACLAWADRSDPAQAEPRVHGDADADERSGLALCTRTGQSLGPGTPRHADQPAWYLPLRGREATRGAVKIAPGEAAEPPTAALLAELQTLCDLAGQALEQIQAAEQAQRAHDDARAAALRSTWLAAVAHDVRTPLASILGASTALREQGERLAAAQRARLLDTVIDEAGHLGQLTDNALQLARLSAAPDALTLDWESPEELIGAVLRRVRGRDPTRRVRARLAGDVPLLRCDAVLISQWLENLVDNALKYGGPDTPVEVLCRREGDEVLLAVRDRGPGLAPAQRQRLLAAFERGEQARAAGIRGAGLGLALCQAVARAHGSAFHLRARAHGGLSAELRLPVPAAPAQELTP